MGERKIGHQEARQLRQPMLRRRLILAQHRVAANMAAAKAAKREKYCERD
jgi:hypothetical protein